MKILAYQPRKNKKAEINLNSTHVTTLDMCQYRVSNITPVLGGDTLDFKYFQKTQVSPLAVNSFGSFDVRTLSFFVPMKSIWHYYEDYRRETNDSSFVNSKQPRLVTFDSLFQQLSVSASYDSTTSSVVYSNPNGISYDKSHSVVLKDSNSSPVVSYTENQFNDFFNETGYTFSDGLNSNSADFVFWDITFPSGSSVPSRVVVHFIWLSSKGREVVSIIEGCGYSLPRSIGPITWFGKSGYKNDVQEFFEYYNTPRDASSLLAFFRCLYDYILPDRELYNFGVGAYFQQDSPTYSFQDWKDFFDLVHLPYDSDFWTSLFVSPNGANADYSTNPVGAVANHPVYSPSDIDKNTLELSNDYYENVLHQSVASKTQVLTSYALRWLQASSDYVLRNSVFGNRIRSFLKAHGLYNGRDVENDRSQLIRVFSDTVDINPVVSMADTSLASLGDQGGQMKCAGTGSFRFDVPSDGYVISISCLIPNIGYCDGTAPWTMQITSPKDLYLPEFDSIGYEAIPKENLYARYGLRLFDGTPFGGGKHNVDFSTPFGFAPTYTNRYRRTKDFLTGDFAFNSRNAGYGSFHTFRDVGRYARNSTLNNNWNFCLAQTDFDRIFQQAPQGSTRDNLYDHFFCVFFFKIRKYSQVGSMSDSLPLFEKGEGTSTQYQGDGGMN